MKIFLLGLPGSGKTTVGKALSSHLSVSFVDLDEDIEKEAKTTVQQIFRLHKEEFFRKLEAKALQRRCQSSEDFVMATGGGAPCFFDNIARINAAGASVFLDVPASLITKRILKTDLSTRPLFAGTRPENLKDAIEFMRSQRLPFYRQANVTVGPDVEATEIVSLLKKESLL